MDSRVLIHQSPRRDAGGLIFAILFPSVAAWIYFFTFADSPAMPVIYALCKVIQFAFPITWFFWTGLDEPRPVARTQIGLPAGAISGLAVAGVMGVAYVMMIQGSELAREASPRIAARIVAIGAASPARFLALTLFLSVAHSFLEEYYWRWFVYGRLRVYCRGFLAGAVSSIAFAGHHVIILHAFIGAGPYWWMTIFLSMAVAAGGGLWAWLYARSGRLFSPWLSHALVDLGIMAIGYHLSRPV